MASLVRGGAVDCRAIHVIGGVRVDGLSGAGSTDAGFADITLDCHDDRGLFAYVVRLPPGGC